MSYERETESYKGYTIKIVSDDDAQNPREFFEPAGTMVCWHGRYNLGDSESWKGMDGKMKSQQLSKNYSEPIDLLYHLANLDTDKEEELRENGDDKELMQLIEEQGTVILPLFLYDHSGITMSTGSFGDRWDSGQVGWIYITKEEYEKEGWTKEQATKYLKGEVETYDNFLTGEVYGWKVVDEDDDAVDSCYGYYGDEGVKDALQEARSTVDWRCKQAQEKYEKQPKSHAAKHYMT